MIDAKQGFLVPMILTNGSIAEIRVPKLERGLRLRRQTPGGLQPSATVQYDIYTLETFAYDLGEGDDKRGVWVAVYVAQDFLPLYVAQGFDAAVRNEALTKYVLDNAPWFFSYGTRR